MSRILKRLTLLSLMLLTASMLLAACGGGDEPTSETGRTDETTDTTEATDDSSSEQVDATTDEPEEEPTEEPTAVPEPTEEPTAVPEPTEEPMEEPTPEPAADFALTGEFNSPAGGFSLNHPSEWLAQDLFGFVVLVSDEELLEADDFGSDGAAALIVSGTQEELEISDDDLEGALNEGFEQMDFGDGEVLEEPQIVNINGQEGARMVVNIVDDIEVTSVIYVLFSGERVAIFMGMSPPVMAEENIPLFDAMVQTLVLSEPEEDAFETGIDLGGPGVGEVEGFLLFGDDVIGTIGESGSSTWDFVGIAGETVDILVLPSSDDLDVVVDVVDIDGNSILPNGAVDDAFGAEEILGLEIVESGTFYVVVSGFDSTDMGEYNLIFNEAGAVAVESGGGDSSSGLDPVSAGVVSYGQSIVGAVTAETALPSYAFTGSAGDIVSVVVDPVAELDVVVDVIDSLGNSIIFAGSDNNFGQEILMVELPEDGEYRVVVSAFDETVTGEFEVTLGGPGGSVIFADDQLEEDAEEHAFPFNALEGDIVNLVVIPDGEFDAVIQLFDEDTDEELYRIDRSFGNEALGYIIPESGNYYFLITGFVADEDNTEGGSNLGNYEVMMMGSDFVLSETTVGDTINGVFSPEDGIIQFFIDLDAGDVLNLTLETRSDLDGVIEIIDLDDNVVASVDDNIAGSNETLSYTAEADGIVLIVVKEFFGLSGPFTLTVDN
ncbi:MAG: hypothetical protein AAF490_05690 [Chloroflexota bacterium]